MDTECRWSVLAQPSQTLRLTLYDFELDVRRAGACHDYMSVTYRRRLPATRGWTAVEVFRECGSLGKQVIDVPASRATIVFSTGRSSLTRRGFILRFQGLRRQPQQPSSLVSSHWAHSMGP